MLLLKRLVFDVWPERFRNISKTVSFTRSDSERDSYNNIAN